jgi:hypothetical protein
MSQVLADRVAALDGQLFAHIEAGVSDHGRKSLLAVHNAVAARSDR